MKSIKTKARTVAQKNNEASSEAAILSRSRQRVVTAVPDIVDALIEQAKTGSYLHAKMLFDFAALTAAPSGDQHGEVSPLLAALFEQLELRRAECAQEPVARSQ